MELFEVRAKRMAKVFDDELRCASHSHWSGTIEETEVFHSLSTHKDCYERLWLFCRIILQSFCLCVCVLILIRTMDSRFLLNEFHQLIIAPFIAPFSILVHLLAEPWMCVLYGTHVICVYKTSIANGEWYSIFLCVPIVVFRASANCILRLTRAHTHKKT